MVLVYLGLVVFVGMTMSKQLDRLGPLPGLQPVRVATLAIGVVTMILLAIGALSYMLDNQTFNHTRAPGAFFMIGFIIFNTTVSFATASRTRSGPAGR